MQKGHHETTNEATVSELWLTMTHDYCPWIQTTLFLSVRELEPCLSTNLSSHAQSSVVFLPVCLHISLAAFLLVSKSVCLFLLHVMLQVLTKYIKKTTTWHDRVCPVSKTPLQDGKYFIIIGNNSSLVQIWGEHMEISFLQSYKSCSTSYWGVSDDVTWCV